VRKTTFTSVGIASGRAASRPGRVRTADSTRAIIVYELVPAAQLNSPDNRLESSPTTPSYSSPTTGPQAAYPADLYFVIARDDRVHFEDRRCNIALLGDELNRKLSAKQRNALVAALPSTMAGVVRKGLARTGS